MQFSLESFISIQPSLKITFDQNQTKLKSEIQIALYSDLQEAQQIFQNHQIKDDQSNPILLFLSTPLVFTQTLYHKIYLLMIKYYNGFISSETNVQKISIIIVNQSQRDDMYGKLMRVLKFAPIGFIKMIKQIVVIKGPKISLIVNNDPLSNYLKGLTVYIDNIHGLDPLGLWSAFNCIRPSLKQKDLLIPDNKPTNNRHNYFRAANLKSTVSIDLNEIMGINKQPKHHDKIDSYELTQFYVPNVLVLLTCLLQQKQQFLKQQGLFRKSVSIEEQKQALQALNSQNIFLLQNITNPHLAANLIKKFFHKVDQPLFPFELYEIITNENFTGEGGFYLQAAVINKLQLSNYMTLKYMIFFFKQCLLPFEKHNKMSIHNLAVVFAPTFIRSQKPTAADLSYMPLLITFIKEIIINSEKFFKIVDKLKHLQKIFPVQSQQYEQDQNNGDLNLVRKHTQTINLQVRQCRSDGQYEQKQNKIDVINDVISSQCQAQLSIVNSQQNSSLAQQQIQNTQSQNIQQISQELKSNKQQQFNNEAEQISQKQQSFEQKKQQQINNIQHQRQQQQQQHLPQDKLPEGKDQSFDSNQVQDFFDYEFAQTIQTATFQTAVPQLSQQQIENTKTFTNLDKKIKQNTDEFQIVQFQQQTK